MLLAPDETLAALYRAIEPHLAPARALGFSHGLAIRFGQIVPRADLDVIMVAPKGPGTRAALALRERKGMVALYAVAQDASGGAEALALAYGRAIGCGRVGLMPTSFAEECDADLFNEAAVVWGAVPEILIAGYDTLVEAGISEEVAFMECVGELKLLAELIEQRGIAGDARGDQQYRRTRRGDAAGRGSSTTASATKCARSLPKSAAARLPTRCRAKQQSDYPRAHVPRANAAAALPVEQARTAAQRTCSATSRSGRPAASRGRRPRRARCSRAAAGGGPRRPTDPAPARASSASSAARRAK